MRNYSTLAVTTTSFKYSITQAQDCIDNNYLIKVTPDSNISPSNYTYFWINEKGDLVGNNSSTFNFTEYIGQINDKPILSSQFKAILDIPTKVPHDSALKRNIHNIVGNGSCEGEGENIVEENNLGCVVPVEDFRALNVTLKEISELGKVEIQKMKKTIFLHAKKHFNLDQQIKELIDNNAF